MPVGELILAVLCGSAVGLSLGLTGGGGSIFALPLLVQVLHTGVREAVAISLATVGLTALFGAILKSDSVRWKAGLLFAAGGIAGAPLGTLIGVKLPERMILVGFATLMLITGWRMLRGRRSEENDGGHPHLAVLLIAGFVTGIMAGIFGVGGGFLIVPALVFGAALPIRVAMATSLLAIALISASTLGFQAAFGVASIPVDILLVFSAGAIGGMAGGTKLRGIFSDLALRRVFAAGMWGVAASLLLS